MEEAVVVEAMEEARRFLLRAEAWRASGHPQYFYGSNTEFYVVHGSKESGALRRALTAATASRPSAAANTIQPPQAG